VFWGSVRGSREVLVEKQMTAHRVDRAICGWFWEYVLAHAAGDPSKVNQTSLCSCQFFVIPLHGELVPLDSRMLMPFVCIEG
jgi:AP-3 complex subunit mu